MSQQRKFFFKRAVVSVLSSSSSSSSNSSSSCIRVLIHFLGDTKSYITYNSKIKDAGHVS